MVKKLTVAIIGTGQIAGGFDQNKRPEDKGVYSHAGAYQKDGRFILKTVYDLDKNKAKKFKDHWQVENIAKSLNEIIEAKHDIVSVCTPDFTHFEIIKALLQNSSAKTIFAEKPLALAENQINEINKLAKSKRINVVVNFQRRFSKSFLFLQDQIKHNKNKLLAVNCFYIKGLDHIGITMIDTLLSLCGMPKGVLTYNRVYNKQVKEYSYEFILYFDKFNITVKTIDSAEYFYNYHIFEFDFLFTNQRIICNANSNQIETKEITEYAYSGVKVLNDQKTKKTDTDYKQSMLLAVEYIYKITDTKTKHSINTIQDYLNNLNVITAIKESHNKERQLKIRSNYEKN
jgi:predicted dehydrogenase